MKCKENFSKINFSLLREPMLPGELVFSKNKLLESERIKTQKYQKQWLRDVKVLQKTWIFKNYSSLELNPSTIKINHKVQFHLVASQPTHKQTQGLGKIQSKNLIWSRLNFTSKTKLQVITRDHLMFKSLTKLKTKKESSKYAW